MRASAGRCVPAGVCALVGRRAGARSYGGDGEAGVLRVGKLAARRAGGGAGGCRWARGHMAGAGACLCMGALAQERRSECVICIRCVRARKGCWVALCTASAEERLVVSPDVAAPSVKETRGSPCVASDDSSRKEPALLSGCFRLAGTSSSAVVFSEVTSMASLRLPLGDRRRDGVAWHSSSDFVCRALAAIAVLLSLSPS